MGRLIDEDKLYEDLANSLSSIMGDGSNGAAIDTYVIIGDIIHDTFAKQPTAYDVDKVVEQLKKESYQEFCDSERIVVLKDAITIVKAGRIDGN